LRVRRTYGCDSDTTGRTVWRGSRRVEGEDDHLPQSITGDQLLCSIDKETLEALHSCRSREEIIEDIWGGSRGWWGRRDGTWRSSLGLRTSLDGTDSEGSDDDFGD
jgi:hypothetical protein